MKKICIAMIAATGLAYGSNAAENLIRNGSFEDETRDWNFLSMHGIVRNLERSTVVQDGDEGLTMRFEKPADKLLNGKYGAWGRIHKTVQVTPGKNYLVRAYVRRSLHACESRRRHRHDSSLCRCRPSGQMASHAGGIHPDLSTMPGFPERNGRQGRSHI